MKKYAIWPIIAIVVVVFIIFTFDAINVGVTNIYLRLHSIKWTGQNTIIGELGEPTTTSVRWLDPIETQLFLVCKNNGFENNGLCMSDLWALGQQESRWDKNAIGINTNKTADISYFQINTIHNLEIDCMTDVYCSADWTLKRLVRNGWPEDRLNALGKHHSKTPKLKRIYLAKLSRYLVKN